MSNTDYRSDECPTRHTGAAFHASSNRVDAPPRSIPVGLPEMVDAEHRLVHHQIQLPVYYSPVPDTQILYVDTLAISWWDWMRTPICLPYSSQESYNGSKNSAAASCSLLKLATLSGSQNNCLEYSSTPPLPDWDQFLFHPLPEQHHLNMRLFQLYGWILSPGN